MPESRRLQSVQAPIIPVIADLIRAHPGTISLGQGAERKHPFLDEIAPLGLVPYLQALLLARHLRGDLDAYPPWFWK